MVDSGTFTTPATMLALAPGVAQGGQRVGGFAGLRYDERQAVWIERRLAVAEFRCDIDLGGDAGNPSNQYFAVSAGVETGAAGGDGERGRGAKIEPGSMPGTTRAVGEVDIFGKRVADDFRLLDNFLGHEVAMIALVDQQRRGLGETHRPLDRPVGAVEDRAGAAGEHHPIALVEIGDAVGEGRERHRIGAEKHLAIAMSDRQRAAAAGADHQVLLALEQDHEGEGASSRPSTARTASLRRAAAAAPRR